MAPRVHVVYLSPNGTTCRGVFESKLQEKKQNKNQSIANSQNSRGVVVFFQPNLKGCNLIIPTFPLITNLKKTGCIFPYIKRKRHLSSNSLQPELSNMNITTILKEFFLPLITKLLQLFPKFNPQHPQPSSSGDAVDPDMAAGDDGVDPVEVPAEAAAGLEVVHHHIHNMDWADLMIGFCLSVALEMASQSAQSNTQLSATFHLLSLAILFAFAFFFVSQFIKPKFLVTAQKLKNFGVFFSVTAIFMAIAIPFPLYFKIATGAIYTISVFAIIICHCL